VLQRQDKYKKLELKTRFLLLVNMFISFEFSSPLLIVRQGFFYNPGVLLCALKAQFCKAAQTAITPH
jgi:hypothetical protein